MSDFRSKREYDREKQEKKKEFSEQEKKQDIVAQDKDKTAKAAGALKQEGTREGAEKVRRAMEQAGKSIDQKMNEEKGKHEHMAQDAQRKEGEVRKAADASKSDALSSERAATEVKTEAGQNAIKEAAKSAAEDQRWLEDHRKNREQERNDSERKTREQVQKVKTTNVKTIR